LFDELHVQIQNPARKMFGNIGKLSCLLGAIGCIAVAGCHKSGSPSSPQTRLQWNLHTTVDAYRSIGASSPAWDQYATNALTEFARSRSGVMRPSEPYNDIIATAAMEAVHAGCNDPLVNYLYVKSYLSANADKDALTSALVTAATQLNQSAYPAVRKFYASLRATEQYAWANNYPTNGPANVEAIHQQLTANFQALLGDASTPVGEIYDAVHEYLHMYSGSSTIYPDIYNRIEPTLFQNWPNASETWLIKGEAYYNMAWQSRGGGYANGVGDDKWKDFFAKLSTADDAIRKAWDINPKDVRIPTLMIRICEGRQKDRQEMELWFGRAMNLNPNNYDACSAKLHYLYPQWYGSRADMLAFGRECVTNTNWGGDVPLILVDAHSEYDRYNRPTEEEQYAYWKDPEVWPDIKAAYERFFELNPDADGTYKNYAWYAYYAGQWSDFLSIAEKVRPEDYGFFGDKESFSQMRKQAKENLSGAVDPK
jgi:tetratricopeptide (TPR) repeat protein